MSSNSLRITLEASCFWILLPHLSFRETKKLSLFLKPFLKFMAKSDLPSNLVCSVVTMHTLILLRILKEFMTNNGKAWTYLNNFMPKFILKSSIGTIKNSSFSPLLWCLFL